MTYEKIHFNDKIVLSFTRKQWLLRGGIGNTLSQEKLGEVYDLISKLHANDSKHAKGSGKTGLAGSEPASNGRY